MELWGAALYGDPCRECRFDWAVTPASAVSFVEGAAAEVRRRVAGATGSERRPGAGWSVAEYVSHVADNLRNWAERVQAARLGGSPEVVGYDPDVLAQARRYEAIPLAVAVWSLEHSCQSWSRVLRDAVSEGVVLVHETRGAQRGEDVARNNCHDVWHHLWDIDQILGDPVARS